MLRDSASYLFDVTGAQHRRRRGAGRWVQPVHSPGRIKIAERRVRQWSKFGAPVELLSREQTRDMTGSDASFGGFWNKTGGHINPLALARGLARTVLGLGAAHLRALAGESSLSAATTAGWSRPPRARFPAARWSWRPMPIAANFETAGADIAREVMPVLSWQMATGPCRTTSATIIPGRQAMSDTHGELYFARYDARNRLVTGGAVIGAGNKVERIGARVASGCSGCGRRSARSRSTTSGTAMSA